MNTSSTIDAGVVIAGGGQAGFQVAASLRQLGFAGPVTIIAAEDRLPYQRPPLSKTYIKTDAGFDSLLIRPDSFYAKNDITVRTGERVVSIDRQGSTVTLDSGEQLAYGHLVLATGAANRTLPVAGATLPGVHGLRTAADAEALRAAIDAANRLVIVGGGFIGLEVAAAVRSLGKDVVLIEAADRLMGRTVSRPVSAFFLDQHRGMGTEIRLETALAAVLGDDRAEGVLLADGTTIAADIVLIAAGVVPEDRLARDAGLATDNGIVVDTFMTTSDPRIFAIGDCAVFESPFTDRPVRLESVQNAVDQAKTVAARVIGPGEPYRSVPWFWSDQGPFKLQVVGLTAGSDHVELGRLGEEGRLIAYCFRGDRLLGIETVNRPGEHMLGRRILGQDLTIARAEVARHDFDLKAHVASLSER
ncbi:FAD-dependent oxidoreductase [Aurantimonas aggregata]|uniref:FAD-dependent oxidoreductase n=1 Tax=Aurantimonas aggregata TaxID=2047720 RepID=A0A6L9MBU4_9HYPH|nr:FAD-dependent oxidoreductase [Aurantimonas aggregata]NDV85314.1 FAD-dependent oxidoreductase [Aurantimonas aggregata]